GRARPSGPAASPAVSSRAARAQTPGPSGTPSHSGQVEVASGGPGPRPGFAASNPPATPGPAQGPGVVISISIVAPRNRIPATGHAGHQHDEVRPRSVRLQPPGRRTSPKLGTGPPRTTAR